jgi:hypothetical protein
MGYSILTYMLNKQFLESKQIAFTTRNMFESMTHSKDEPSCDLLKLDEAGHTNLLWFRNFERKLSYKYPICLFCTEYRYSILSKLHEKGYQTLSDRITADCNHLVLIEFQNCNDYFDGISLHF